MSGLPPLITETARPFWEGLRAERIVLQRCTDCRHWIFYPRVLCPFCSSIKLDWEMASGDATLYSFTVAHYPVSPDFPEVPTILALVDLDEGVRIPVRLEPFHEPRLRIGMRMVATFDHEEFADVTMLSFAPYDREIGKSEATG